MSSARRQGRSRPRVAIALAAYRPKPRFFSQQLQSLVDQTFQQWICVITFDSPMRNALKHPSIKKFQRDRRFVWRQNPARLGFAQNFGRAMELALTYRPAAIAFCDQDDVWLPNKLQTSLEALERCPPESLVHCDAVVVDQQLKTLFESNWGEWNALPQLASLRHLLLRFKVIGASALFDARLARVAMRLPLSANAPHDFRISFAAALRGGSYPIRERLYLYRQHAGNVYGAIERQQSEALARREETRRRLGRSNLMHKLRSTLHKVRRGCDRFERVKGLAGAISQVPGVRIRYRSHAYLLWIALLCAAEYAVRGKDGRFALSLFFFGLLTPFRRSAIKRRLGFSRRRSAPRRRS